MSDEFKQFCIMSKIERVTLISTNSSFIKDSEHTTYDRDNIHILTCTNSEGQVILDILDSNKIYSKGVLLTDDSLIVGAIRLWADDIMNNRGSLWVKNLELSEEVEKLKSEIAKLNLSNAEKKENANEHKK